MTKAHFQYISLHLFLNTIRKQEFKDERIRGWMLLLARIYALDILIKDPAACYDSGFFGADSTVNMRQALAEVVDEIRP